MLETVGRFACGGGCDAGTVWFVCLPSPNARAAAAAIHSELTAAAIARRRPRPGALVPGRIANRWRRELGEWRKLQPLVNAAEMIDVPVRRTWPGTVATLSLGDGARRRRIYGTVHDSDSAAALVVGLDKELSRAVLDQLGVAQPHGTVVWSYDDAADAANALGYPVVLKQPRSADSYGVVARVADSDHLRRSWDHLALPRERLLVEERLDGATYRVLLVDGEVLRVAEGRSATIRGDGTSTIRTLIRLDPRRAWWLDEPALAHRLDAILLSQELMVADVPAQGAVVAVSPPVDEWRHLSRSSLHRENRRMVERLGRYLAPAIVGIDVVCTRLDRPWGGANGGVVDVNPAAGTWFHDDQAALAARFLERLGLIDEPARIPITCFVGEDADAAARAAAGREEGVDPETSDAFLLLDDPHTTSAFVAVTPQDFAARGLAFDRCDALNVLPGASQALLAILSTTATATLHPSPIGA